MVPGGLVRIARQPRRRVLPHRDVEAFDIRHLNGGQRLIGHHVVFLDHIVAEENKRCKGVDFIRFQRSLLTERHAAVNVIPDDCREGLVHSYGVRVVHTRLKTAHLAFFGTRLLALNQSGSVVFRIAIGSMASRALNLVNRRAFFRRSVPRRKFLAVRADDDVPGFNFSFGGGPAHSIIRRLRPGDAANEKTSRKEEYFITKVHWSRFHPLRRSKAEWCCHCRVRGFDPAGR